MKRKSDYKNIVVEISTGIAHIFQSQWEAAVFTKRTGEAIRQRLLMGRVNIGDEFMIYPYSEEMATSLNAKIVS